jgi:hypothetical protein
MQAGRVTLALRSSVRAAIVLPLLLAGCENMPMPTRSDDSAAQADVLVPDPTFALESHPDNYIAFLKGWFEGTRPQIDAADIVRYSLAANDRTAELAAEKLIFGHEAFCQQNGGTMTKEPPALTCVGSDGKPLARLSVQVFHSSDAQPGALQFTGESARWMSRLDEARLTDYRRVLDTLSGNGVAGGVLLASGEGFDVVRFGRLSGPDFYALKTPNHGLIWLSDIVSVKWSADALNVTQRGGEQFVESGKGLTPGNTIVRLRPTDNDQLVAEALSFEDPFRFVYVDPRSKQPRQVRVRADTQILQITISPKASKYRGGMIDTRFDKKDREAFRRSLVADARKTAANTGRKTDSLDLSDTKLRSDMEQLGRAGPCVRTLSEDRLRTGDIAYTEYLVCGEYRQEADAVKTTGGVLTPDKTPLLFLGRAARAPWYDFNGVLR